MEDTPKKRKWTDRLTQTVKNVLFGVLTYGLLLLICVLAISPEQYDLSVGDVAPKTITASRDVVDEITTERRRKAAADAVSPVYYKDDSISETVLNDMEAVFGELRAVRELGAQIEAGFTSPEDGFVDADYEQASRMLTRLRLSNYQLRTLMSTNEQDFESLHLSLMSATRTTLVTTITEGSISDAITNIQQIVAYNTRTNLWYNVAIPTLHACLQPNMLIDQEATEENREKAREAVEPTVYKQDQNVVLKGSRISAEQIAVLESLGLLAGNGMNTGLYVGTALILGLILAGMYIYIYLFEPRMLCVGRSAFVLQIAVVLTVALSVLMGMYLSPNAMPVVLAAMLVVGLFGAREAFVVNFVTALIVSFLTFMGPELMTSQMLSVLLMTCVGGIVSILMLRGNTTRFFILVTGLVVGVVNFAILAATNAMFTGNMVTVLAAAAYAFVGSLSAAVMCIGLQPILETGFSLVTPSKLLELSSPNQPLLRRLMIEAPGTYHHSMVVANLAEAAAETVGANALLARVGAYYHDIGKLVRPMYFKENQMGDNPHDRTDARVSTAILTEHTKDGEKLARKHHLPEPIVEIIKQHHGDTPVMYFYAKACRELGEENVDIADYRYEGPKPQTSEAAILMLSDTVEAAVRSMQEPTQEKISALIRKLVRGKMEDGQLDECTLTFRDIDRICFAFETALQGVFHERIEYPDVKIKGQDVPAAPNETAEQSDEEAAK